MPRRKKYGSKASARRNRGRRSNRGVIRKNRFSRRINRKASKTIIKTRNGVTDKTYIKFRWSANTAISNTNGVYAGITLAGNSIYDPALATGSSQPYGFDQWLPGKYQNYLVYGSKISIEFYSNNLTTSTNSIIFGSIYPSKDSTISASTNAELWEYPYIKTKTNNYYAGQNRLTHYMSSGKMFGLNKNEVTMRESEFGALYNANPTALWYWHIIFGSVYPSGTSSTNWGAYAKIVTTFYCRLRNRPLFAPS